MSKYSSSKIKSLFYGRAKAIAIISIVLIISISYGLFFYFQDGAESSVRKRRTMELELSNEEIRDHPTLVEKELEHLYFDSESKSYKNLPF